MARLMGHLGGCNRPCPGLMAQGTIVNPQATWYFDFISPFAYLQWQRLWQLRNNRWIFRPILFAGILNQLGTKGPTEIPAKRTFTYRHVTWRAQRSGIALIFPRAHPFNPLPALRLCIAAGTTTEAIDTVFRYLWEEGRPIETAEELGDSARRLGLAAAIPALADPEPKRLLRENFAHALRDHVFGVPTIVCDGQIFWGDDATDMFLDYVRDPAAFNSVQMERATNLPIGQARPQGVSSPVT